jgi:hypothetical protein
LVGLAVFSTVIAGATSAPVTVCVSSSLASLSSSSVPVTVTSLVWVSPALSVSDLVAVYSQVSSLSSRPLRLVSPVTYVGLKSSPLTAVPLSSTMSTSNGSVTTLWLVTK